MNIASALSGKSRQLDRKAAPDELVRESDVTDPPRLAKLLTRMVKALAGLDRAFVPRRTDFEDVPLGSGTYHSFPHGFGGRVRWWVVDSLGTPILYRSTTTDENTLVLYSSAAVTVTVRVEEVG